MLSKKLISQVMTELGRKGGKIGGKRSLDTMTAEERSDRARKASMVAAAKRTAERLAREASARDLSQSTPRRHKGLPHPGASSEQKGLTPALPRLKKIKTKK